MVFKVLNIIAGIMVSLLGLALVGCLAYTVMSPAVQNGIGGVKGAVEDLVSSATSALSAGTSAGSGEGSGSSGAAGFIDGLLGTVSGGAEQIADAVGSVAGLAGGQSAPAESFADPAWAQSYATWSNAIANPVDKVLAGTGIDASVLEAVASGSTSASSLLTELDEGTLGTVSANASTYAATAAANYVPASLPQEAQAQMQAANASAQDFASAVQTLVGCVRDLKGGNVFVLGDLSSAANAAYGALQAMDSSVAAAEAALAA